MARQVEGDERTLQRQRDRVVGVRVLGPAVDQRELGRRVPPGQAAQLAQPVDRHEEPTHGRDGHVEAPLGEVLAEERELVVGDGAHARHRRRRLLTDDEVSRPTCVVVLAAGEGTRMRSSRPKPLHQLCGRPMVLYVMDAAADEDVRALVVVVGHGATWVEKSVRESADPGVSLTFVEQAEQLGTGHAVSVALPAVSDVIGGTDGDVLILPGDTPLLRAGTVRALLARHREGQAALTVLSADVDDPTGYGRVVRRQGRHGRAHRRGARRERRRARDPRGQHGDHGGSPQRARPRAAPGRAPQRPERVLPDRPRGRAARRGSRHRRDAASATPPRPRGSTTVPSSPRPRPCCASASTTAGCSAA